MKTMPILQIKNTLVLPLPRSIVYNVVVASLTIYAVTVVTYLDLDV
jgi:hypothetical protein